MSDRIFAITSVYDEPGLLPHFLDHYTRLGVHRILIVVRGAERDERYRRAVEWARRFPAEVSWFRSEFFADSDKAEVESQVLRDAGVEADDYVMHLDLDEFHEYPAPLGEIVALMNRHDDWAVRGWFLDRMAPGGVLTTIRPSPSIGEQFPIACDFTDKLLHAWTQKIMLCRGRVELQGGVNHETCNAYYDRVPVGRAADYLVHHFKWTKGIDARLRERLEKAAICEAYADECRLFLQSFRETGKIDLSDPRLGARWRGGLTYPSCRVSMPDGSST
jgi:hypothetical protein